jgi:hypothetical protein
VGSVGPDLELFSLDENVCAIPCQTGSEHMISWKWLGFSAALVGIACSSSSDDGDGNGKLSGTGGVAGAAGASLGGGGTSVGGSAGTSVGGIGGGSAGIAGGGGVASADAGTDGSTCDQTFGDYKSALAAAGKCTPGAPSQCEHLVQSNPGCGEYTLVQETNTDALADLASLKAAWDNAGCSYVCGVGGHGATEAICESSGGEGHCKVTKY